MKDQEKNTGTQPKGTAPQAKMEVVKKSEPVKAAETSKSEVEKLKEELASLKSQLAEKPMSLEDKIKFFQEKKAKIDKLTKLEAYAEGLIKVGQEAQETSEQDEFFSEKFSVRVTRKANSYRSEGEDILTINNPVLVVEVLGYALERINAKRSQLQTEIEA